MKRIIDLHIHTGPDVRPRRFDDIAMARLALERGARGIVLKSHVTLTADRATLVRDNVPGIEVFGGIVLNHAVGGLNPRAVESALRMGAKIIWMPTLDAANHQAWEGRAGGNGITIIRNGRLDPAVHPILQQVADADVCLATGHLSIEEIKILFEEASAAGIRKLLVNHPEHGVIAMDFETQGALVRDYAAVLERCFFYPDAQGRYHDNRLANLKAIQALGHESTILASDAGQLETTPWDVSWPTCIGFLRENGVDDAALKWMSELAPARILGLE